MTFKRDKKIEPKAKRPKLKKETLRDLEAKAGQNVMGGVGVQCTQTAGKSPDSC